LQLKYEFKHTDTETITLNDTPVELRVSNKSGNIISRYYYIPQDIIYSGYNVLKINFHPHNPDTIDIKIKNHLISLAGGNIILTLKDSNLNRKNLASLVLGVLLISLYLFYFWKGLVFLGGEIFSVAFLISTFNAYISFIPCGILYLILGVNSFFGPYSLLVNPFYLIGFFSILTLISNICLNFFFLYLVSCLIVDKKVADNFCP